MKKLFTFLAIMTLALAQTAISQDITLTFDGYFLNGDNVTMDSVKVENLNRNWTETLVHESLSFNLTSIRGAESSELELQSYPNPFNGKTTVRMSVPQSGNVTLQIYNLAGQKIVETEKFLNAGEHTFGITLKNTEINLLTIKTTNGQKTIKLLNNGGSASNAIVYNGMEPAEKRLSTQIYQIGDVLRIVGYSHFYGVVVRSSEIFKSPTENEHYALYFNISNYHTPYVTTTAASNITTNTAVSGGRVTDSGGLTVTSRGVCWSLLHNPDLSDSHHTTDGSGLGSFTSNITGLSPNTTYYVRAYAINAVGAAFGQEISFTTTAAPPTVTTTVASNITDSSAVCGGNVTSAGSYAVTARGVCWSTSQNPTISSSHTTDGSGTGSFTSSITGLDASTTYYVRAYAISAVDTAYGSQITFTTPIGLPIVTTTAASNVTSTTATCGGNVTRTGGSAVTARGVCWSSRSLSPTTSDSHTTDSSGMGSFTSNITGLTPGTRYFFRAYATNAAGTAYGILMDFTTPTATPTVTTTAVSNITGTSATIGGNITDNGGSVVTASGVCWSTSQNPTISGNHTIDGSILGSFTSNLTGLTTGTTYYVRAYATNAVGTAYGNQISFIPLPPGGLPGIFSIGITSRVRFSKGNLQWSAKNGGSTATTHTVAGGGTAAGTWRFAEHQYDVIGNDNSNISSSYSGWIDLFGWGTSGWNSGANAYQPYSTIAGDSNYYPGGAHNNNLTGTYANADWGIYNAISNGGNQPGLWRTLRKTEWDTLIDFRTTASGMRYAKATVNGVLGLIILPDNWDTATYAIDSANIQTATFSANVVSAAQWTTLENAGCVFLPFAGSRDGSTVNYVNNGGYYWSATYYYREHSYCTTITINSVHTYNYRHRNYGHSVRLVQKVP